MCLGQILAENIHNDFSLRNNIIQKPAVLQISIFLHKRNLHRRIPLQIWHRISCVIGHGRLYTGALKIQLLLLSSKELGIFWSSVSWDTLKQILETNVSKMKSV